ncbi:MAG: hypothetical protein ACI8QD_002344 [Cyclobacteriaceae bacterium]|jgi:hypothetical protein
MFFKVESFFVRIAVVPQWKALGLIDLNIKFRSLVAYSFYRVYMVLLGLDQDYFD